MEKVHKQKMVWFTYPKKKGTNSTVSSQEINFFEDKTRKETKSTIPEREFWGAEKLFKNFALALKRPYFKDSDTRLSKVTFTKYVEKNIELFEACRKCKGQDKMCKPCQKRLLKRVDDLWKGVKTISLEGKYEVLDKKIRIAFQKDNEVYSDIVNKLRENNKDAINEAENLIQEWRKRDNKKRNKYKKKLDALFKEAIMGDYKNGSNPWGHYRYTDMIKRVATNLTLPQVEVLHGKKVEKVEVLDGVARPAVSGWKDCPDPLLRQAYKNDGEVYTSKTPTKTNPWAEL